MQTPETAIAPARQASTVVVARDAANSNIEIVLIQRHAGLRFMAGAYVFPGGAVQANDSDATSIATHALAWPESSTADADRAHAVAAIRETFEEVGLLLGTAAVELSRLRGLRAQALAGIDFGALLGLSRLQLDLSVLVPLVRWITPLSEPIRFDTCFYVARCPEGQVAEHEAQESVDLQWLTPAAALERAASGAMLLAPPTRRTLEEIREVTSVAELIQVARQRQAPTVMPVIREIDGVRWLLFPAMLRIQSQPGRSRGRRGFASEGGSQDEDAHAHGYVDVLHLAEVPPYLETRANYEWRHRWIEHVVVQP